MVKIKPLEPGWFGQPVRIYRNLNNGTMSVQGKSGAAWRVIGHVTEATLQDVVFKISSASQARARQEQVRNVHAWGQGILVADVAAIATLPLYYHSFKSDTFQAGDFAGPPVYRARWLVVHNNLPYLSPDAPRHPCDRWEDTPPQLTLLQDIPHGNDRLWEPQFRRGAA